MGEKNRTTGWRERWKCGDWLWKTKLEFRSTSCWLRWWKRVTVLLSCVCVCACVWCIDVCTAVGCPDVMTSQHMWTTRSGDQLIAGCVTSEVTWTLTCVGNWWQGVSSNCSVGKWRLFTTQLTWHYLLYVAASQTWHCQRVMFLRCAV